MNRRQALVLGSGVLPLATASFWKVDAAEAIPNRLGVTDWSIGGRGTLDAFEAAGRSGLDGLQISFLPEPNAARGEYDLRSAEDRERVRARSQQSGIAISSTAMGVFNRSPFKEVPEAIEWTRAGIEATRAMGCDVMLLAFFAKNNLKNDPEGTAATIRRLKEVAPFAEDQGVTLGLETTLDLAEHLHIIDSIGSPAVQVYYDLGNSHHSGYPIAEEIRQLGGERICELHCKDRKGGIFGAGEVDFAEALAALREIGYAGWFILEGPSGKGLDAVETMRRNGDFLRQAGYAPAQS